MFCVTACTSCQYGVPTATVDGTNVDEARVRPPAVDNTPLNTFELALAAEELVKRAASRRTAVLRVLRERNRPGDAVLAHGARRRARLRVRVTESDVVLVRGRLRRELVHQLGHALALNVRPLQNRRAAANVRVLLLDLRRPPTCDERCKIFLHRQGDQVSVEEEVRQEVLRLADLEGSW
jgi:hypothetical protein